MLDTIKANPPWRIGIIGGGQLGKMMAVAAKQLGFAVTVLDPQVSCPAAGVADSHIVADFHDQGALAKLVKGSDVTTYEFEHIDSEILIELAREGLAIHPEPSILQAIQNKLTQKNVLAREDIPVPAYMEVTALEDIKQAGKQYGYPLILKACSGGYDGKGNFLIKGPEDIQEALNTLVNCQLLVEQYIPFQQEVSVMVARDLRGKIAVYPLSENQHEDNILRLNNVPARVEANIAKKSFDIAAKVIEVFRGSGVFCVEMFVTNEGQVLVNEVAPRPHNSGHYTIEACVTSQFEQHVRAITGLPLGSTRLIESAVTINLLGEPGHQGAAVLKGCSRALAFPGVHLHFYGKATTQSKRKMGHVTITAPALEQALEIADQVQGMLQVVSEDYIEEVQRNE